MTAGSRMSSSRSTSRAVSAKPASRLGRAEASGSIERLRGEAAVGARHDLVDLGLRFGELRLAMAPQLRATLVTGNRLVELPLAAFEPLHDLLELGDRLLEAHGLNVGRNLLLWHGHHWSAAGFVPERLSYRSGAAPGKQLCGRQAAIKARTWAAALSPSAWKS